MASEKKSGGAADSNDGSSAASKIDPNDPLGYDVYAKTLWSRIEHALNRDPHNTELGDDPLVVGLFGEWGVGKSYLLDKIQARATAKQKELAARRRLDGGFDLLIPVSFQPWKYEHEEHLHVPILLHVLAALEAGIGESLTFWETAAGKAQKPGDAVIKAMPKAVSLFKKVVFGTAAALDPTTTVAVASTQVLADHAATAADKRAASKNPPTASALKYTGDGRYYYEIHKILKAVCRPGKYPDLQANKLLNDVFRVNFVIFVDDLDRCLPEKAVAVLELIKTIFNVESFAFVLALDDEVIERGIGHRYSAYLLKDKKPQMPITGFEYLEKIVHLPFRLPALTRAQATDFVRYTEKKVEPDEALHWFAPRAAPTLPRVIELTKAYDVDAARSDDQRREEESPHMALLLGCFDAYVPRKLLRAVELWHQVVRVRVARSGDTVTADFFSAWAGVSELRTPISIDTRVVFGFVLLQLFQPELFRFMRRRADAFPILLRAFADEADGLNKFEVSSVDLWSWASYREGEKQSDKEKRRPQNEEQTVALIARLESTDAYQAQHIRLGLAERLVEHFAVQRHVFSPLKLMHALAKIQGQTARNFGNISAYFAVLAQQSLAVEVSSITGDPGSPASGELAAITFTLSDADSDVLFDLLVGVDTAARGGIQARFALPAQQSLNEPSGARLKQKFDQWRKDKLSSSGGFSEVDYSHAIGALGAVAPWLDWRRDGAEALSTLAGIPPQIGATSSAIVDEVVARAPSAILRAEIGDLLNRFLARDPRFDVKRHFLPKDRFKGHTPLQEPIPGFVLIPAGPFWMGHDTEAQTNDNGETTNDNPSRVVEIAKPFYVARTLTTVDQFALFVDDEDYVDAVRTGARGAAKKAGENWKTPREWVKQREFGNRPAVGVNWFQARAYARWLDARLRQETDSALAKLSGYEVRLPNEAQWERAARATGLGAKDVHTDRWPYGATEQTLKKSANIRQSGIERVSSVGVFPPTAIGLSDIVGNAWQWMDNEYLPRADDRFPTVTDAAERAAMKDRGKHLMTLRGGSWIRLPELASCSVRYRDRPVDLRNFVGFRVVLSLVSSSEA